MMSLRSSNVSSALLWVLYALNDGNPHTQIEISNDWELPKTTVNTVIKDIQKDGYVELVPIKGRRDVNYPYRNSKAFADNVLSNLYKKKQRYLNLLVQKKSRK